MFEDLARVRLAANARPESLEEIGADELPAGGGGGRTPAWASDLSGRGSMLRQPPSANGRGEDQARCRSTMAKRTPPMSRGGRAAMTALRRWCERDTFHEGRIYRRRSAWVP